MGVISKCFVLVAVLGAACTKKVNECSSDSDCKDIAYPFCDVDGHYAASGGDHNVCTIVPPDCSVSRCGCSPGAVTCASGDLETCNPDGKSTTSTTCVLGCAATGDRCFSFKPSNGLDAAMNVAQGEADVTFATDITIDTDACSVHDSTNLSVAVKTLSLTQTSAPGICAVVGRSFHIGNVVATGSSALAFVAPGAIELAGKVDLAARDRYMANLNGGPGSVTVGACVPDPEYGEAGGGGNATNGGDGVTLASVPIHRKGGLAQTNFTPLIGGCAGVGTGGGGALQVVSFTSITLGGSGLIALGGVGSSEGGGGSSGGTLVLEAPSVALAGSIAANGGGGGVANQSCTAFGGDATNDNTPAPGATCGTGFHGGAGGTATSPPADGTPDGGGGGSVGRVLIRTTDGTFTGPGPVFSIVPTTDTLVKI